MSKIQKIKARQILDSRGNPTVEVDILCEGGAQGRAAVPSGASTGKREAIELRDQRKDYYLGKSVLKAVANIHDKIAPALIGREVQDQRGLDSLMLELDGTSNKSKLGANAILAVSMACSRAGAHGRPLFQYLAQELKVPCRYSAETLPAPMMNIINGGAHASNNLDIQEFMIIPHMDKTFGENLRAGVEIFHCLKEVLGEKNYSTNVGDEGGFAPNLKGHEEALDLILKAIEIAGYRPGEDISLCLDAASSEFYCEGQYHMQGERLNSSDMIDYYSTLCAKYPIYSLEDGLYEEDFAGWSQLTEKLGSKILTIGDDLFVTNKKILEVGIKEKQANAILVKVNQIGSLTETFETLDLAYQNSFEAVISHRSGETGDAFIADLAVASGAGHIKTGSASRSDRMEKYNQLLRIEEELGEKAKFHKVK